MEQVIIHRLWRLIVIYEKIQYDEKGVPSLDIYARQNDETVCVNDRTVISKYTISLVKEH